MENDKEDDVVDWEGKTWHPKIRKYRDGLSRAFNVRIGWSKTRDWVIQDCPYYFSHLDDVKYALPRMGLKGKK